MSRRYSVSEIQAVPRTTYRVYGVTVWVYEGEEYEEFQQIGFTYRSVEAARKVAPIPTDFSRVIIVERSNKIVEETLAVR